MKKKKSQVHYKIYLNILISHSKTPAGLTPAGLTPAGLTPAGLTPVGLIPLQKK